MPITIILFFLDGFQQREKSLDSAQNTIIFLIIYINLDTFLISLDDKYNFLLAYFYAVGEVPKKDMGYAGGLPAYVPAFLTYLMNFVGRDVWTKRNQCIFFELYSTTK
jgi:hypothetical protein